MAKEKIIDSIRKLLLFFLTVLSAAFAAYLYQKTVYEIAETVVFTSIAAGGMLFQMAEKEHTENTGRFFLLYLLFLILSVFFPLIPEGGYPYLAVFTGLMLFSDRMTAMSAGSTLLLISVLLCSDGDAVLFIMYFVIGMVGVYLFYGLDESFQVGRPLLCSLLLQFVCLSVWEILLANDGFSMEMLIVPAFNTLVSLILMVILLKLFSFSIIYRTRDAYMDVNDPECPLLVRLKEQSREEYFHAIHTAYLCERIASKLYMNAAAAKAGGYYHKIGVLQNDNSYEAVEGILAEYHMPGQALQILKEYLQPDIPIRSRETVVLLFADTMISSISYLFKKNKEAVLDYDKLVETVFQKKISSGILNQSEISIGDLEQMKKILAGEQLYYDFLR